MTIIPTNCEDGVAFTPDNQSLICGGNRLAMFALPQGTPSPYLTGNTGSVNAVAYSPAGNLIATAGSDSIISVRDSAGGSVLSQLDSSATNLTITGLAFSPDGTKIAASLDNTVGVWNTAGYTPVATLTGHIQDVTAVAFSPDSTLLASAKPVPVCPNRS